VEEVGEKSAVAVNFPSQRDLEALQGQWEQVSLEVDGVTNPPDDLSPPGGVTAFSGNRFTVHAVNGQLLLEGTFTLDASASPKRVDWIDAMVRMRVSRFRQSICWKVIVSYLSQPMPVPRGQRSFAPAPDKSCGRSSGVEGGFHYHPRRATCEARSEVAWLAGNDKWGLAKPLPAPPPAP
jgi:uncharacterized protein (TIGR03067 family)